MCVPHCGRRRDRFDTYFLLFLWIDMSPRCTLVYLNVCVCVCVMQRNPKHVFCDPFAMRRVRSAYYAYVGRILHVFLWSLCNDERLYTLEGA